MDGQMENQKNMPPHQLGDKKITVGLKKIQKGFKGSKLELGVTFPFQFPERADPYHPL